MTYDGHAPLVLFASDYRRDDGLQLLGELHDVHLVGDQRIAALVVAVKKHLLDQFFVKVRFHSWISRVPS